MMKLLKVKPFRQSVGYCGPASLKMLLAYYGIAASENFLAKLSGASHKTGVRAQGLIQAAKHFGFKGFVKKLADFQDIRHWMNTKKIPVIVDWFSTDEGHYSVVVGIDSQNIYLQDPELGRLRKMDLPTFKCVWFDFPKSYIRTPRDILLRNMIVFSPPSLKNNH